MKNSENNKTTNFLTERLTEDVGLTIMQMSQIAGCSPAEYSAYEHEQKPFDPEVYKKCKAYLSNILERGDGE